MKKPWLAALLNVFPGLGYLYLDKKRVLGWLLVAASIAAIIVSFEPSSSSADSSSTQGIWNLWTTLIIVLPITGFVVDGGIAARKLNANIERQGSSNSSTPNGIDVSAKLSALPTAHTGPGDLSRLSKREQEWIRQRGLGETPNVDFLIRNPWIFAAAYIVSGTLYGLYVVYKNWQAIRDASGRRISPFWRTVFLLFYLWPLFKTAVLLAKARGFKARYSGGFLFLLYLIGSFAVELVTFFFSTSELSNYALMLLLYGVQILCFIPAGRAAQAVLSKQPRTKPRAFNWVEWLFVVIGVFGLITSQTVYRLERHDKIHKDHSGWQVMQIISAQSQYNVLTVDYQQCEASMPAHQATSKECDSLGRRADQAEKHYDSLAGTPYSGSITQ